MVSTVLYPRGSHKLLKVITIPVTPFAQNARVVFCSETKKGAIIDPGGDVDRIEAECERVGVDVVAIWLTHSHLDHCAGVARALELYRVPLVGHKDERIMRERLPEIAQMYGLPSKEWPACPEPDRYIGGGEVLELGNLSAQVLFTPGHSPGHVSFYFASEGVVISGDALFQGSIGRTDLPGGDHALLIKSIKERLLTLPTDTRVLSGHGDDTTNGLERSSNPFLA
ncbi:MAG: MBL fold metallo-hydrolase, partial [Pseudomonadota bacterium]